MRKTTIQSLAKKYKGVALLRQVQKAKLKDEAGRGYNLQKIHKEIYGARTTAEKAPRVTTRNDVVSVLRAEREFFMARIASIDALLSAYGVDSKG